MISFLQVLHPEFYSISCFHVSETQPEINREFVWMSMRANTA